MKWKNRLFCLLVAAVISMVCLGNISAAAAASENKNLIVNSGMDKDLSNWVARNGSILTWQKGGAAGTDGCAKVELVGGFSAIAYNISFVKGETYDISFYIRMDKGSSTVTVIQNFSDGGWWYIAQNVDINNKWKKISLTYTFDGKNTKDAEVGGSGVLEFRIADGQQKLVHYLDEVKVVPYGNVKEQAPALENYEDNVPLLRQTPAVAFDDIKGHWAEQTIEMMAENNLVKGVSPTSFQPQRAVTRAEFVSLILTGMRLDLSKYANAYRDVKEYDWFADDMQTACVLGIIDKVMSPGGMVRPQMPITREEAASILAKVATLKGIPENLPPAEYADGGGISVWAADYVEKATKCGLISGYGDGSFKPQNCITRAEAVEILKRIVETDGRMAIYIDPVDGDDGNFGSREKPLKTLYAAQDIIRKNNKDMKHNIYVFLKAGVHTMDKELAMSDQDSGSNGYKIIYTSYGGGKAVLSGGREVSGWTLHDARKNIYKAYVGKGVDTRQLFVNGVRAVRARSNGGLANCTTDDGTVGHTTTDTFLADFKHVSDLEMVYYEQWTNPRCGVDSITVKDGIATIKMKQPGWKSVRNKGGTSVTKPVYYENAYELLDEEGEWYLDKWDGYLYYKPRTFEDIHKAEVVMPLLERMITLKGGALDKPIHSIEFNNIAFKYTTWLRPSTNVGHPDAQNNHLRDIGDKLPDAAVMVDRAKYIDFKGCEFSKLGITALELIGGVQNCNVTGNEFYDISGTAISLGEPNTKDKNVYNPTDPRYMIKDNNITNNYIHTIGVDYMSAAAISAGFPVQCNISHNEIFDTPYSGMHIGYGWNTLPTSATKDFKIQYNYIHDVLNNKIYDGGGIYTIGATGGTPEAPNIISDNYIKDVRNCFGALYTDEGTTNWTITRNVIDLAGVEYWPGKGDKRDKPKWFHAWVNTIRNIRVTDNYSTTDEKINNSTNSVFEEPLVFPDAQWPQDALNIIENSGIQPEYIQQFPDQLQVAKVKDKYFVNEGDKFKLEISGKTRKDKEADLNDSKIYYISRNTDVALVDSSGNVTALKQGACTIEVDVLMKDVLKKFNVGIFVGDRLDKLGFEGVDNNKIRIAKGFKYTLKVKGISLFGNDAELEKIEYSSADENIARVDQAGVVLGVNPGATTLTARATAKGYTVENKIDVSVIGLGSGQEIKNNGFDMSPFILDNNNWIVDESGKREMLDDGVRLSTPSGTMGFAAYGGRVFSDELLTFDMQINADSGWPSITLRNDSLTAPYSSANEYMITFNKDTVELQRFNKGKRTVIYGNVSGADSLVGGGIPNTFYKFREKFNVQVGAKNEPDGVRITLDINGINVIDYLDTSEDRITTPGYFNVYARSGDIELHALGGE